MGTHLRFPQVIFYKPSIHLCLGHVILKGRGGQILISRDKPTAGGLGRPPANVRSSSPCQTPQQLLRFQALPRA